MKTTYARGYRWLLANLMFASFIGSMALAGEEFKEELHQTYSLTPEGQIRLDNVNGTVRIGGWDRSEVKLDAIKRARAKEDLGPVKIEIEAKPDGLTIRTKYPERKWWNFLSHDNSTSVDYILTVPQAVRFVAVTDVNGAVEIGGVRGKVKASTVNGGLSVNGLAANADLSSVNGAIKAGFASTDAVKSVSISTVNGHVELELPADADADLSVSTVNGTIGGDVSVRKNWPVGSEVKTRLGGGGAEIKASTVNGGVHIHLVKPAK